MRKYDKRSLRRFGQFSQNALRQKFLKERLKIQNNKCAICQSDLDLSTRKNYHIDHCHYSKEYRGILCPHCNLGLGYFKDNIVSLYRAILYLLKGDKQTLKEYSIYLEKLR